MSGHTKKAYNSVVRCVTSPAEFFADELYTSMKGLGTDNKKLIRIIVSRAEVVYVCALPAKVSGQIVISATSGS